MKGDAECYLNILERSYKNTVTYTIVSPQDISN